MAHKKIDYDKTYLRYCSSTKSSTSTANHSHRTKGKSPTDSLYASFFLTFNLFCYIQQSFLGPFMNMNEIS